MKYLTIFFFSLSLLAIQVEDFHERYKEIKNATKTADAIRDRTLARYFQILNGEDGNAKELENLLQSEWFIKSVDSGVKMYKEVISEAEKLLGETENTTDRRVIQGRLSLEDFKIPSLEYNVKIYKDVKKKAASL